MIFSELPLRSAFYRNFHEFVRFMLSRSVSWIFILVIFCFFWGYLHSKIYQRKVRKTLPTLSSLTYLRAVIVNRRRANSFFLELIFGVCYLFPKDEMYSIMLGPVKYVFLYNLDAVKFVLGNSKLLRKGSEYEFFRAYLRDGLLVSSGKKWQTRRKQLTHSFHFRIVNEFFVSFNKQANAAVQKIDELMKKETVVDVTDIIGLCTLDIILETAIGVSPSKIGPKRKEFLKSLNTVERIVSKRVVLPWLWIDFIFSKTEEGKILSKCLESMQGFLSELVMERKQNMRERFNVEKNSGVIQSNHDVNSGTKERLALLDFMMSLHLKDNSVSLEDMYEEIQMAIAAAQHTTSVAVSWTLYLLSLHQDIQRSIQHEVDTVLGDDVDRTVTAEDVKSLKYLHCVLKEAMRLYPPVGIISRILEEDTIINGHEIGKGTSLAIPVYMLHRNSEVFHNPERFIPDRFNEQNLKNIPTFSYIPFSAGPRNCIGQRFATHSAMTILSNVLRHFSVHPLEHRDKIGFTFDVVTEPENGIHLKFSRRQFLRDY